MKIELSSLLVFHINSRNPALHHLVELGGGACPGPWGGWKDIRERGVVQAASSPWSSRQFLRASVFSSLRGLDQHIALNSVWFCEITHIHRVKSTFLFFHTSEGRCRGVNLMICGPGELMRLLTWRNLRTPFYYELQSLTVLSPFRLFMPVFTLGNINPKYHSMLKPDPKVRKFIFLLL